MNRKIECILQILLAAGLSLYCYTFLHELGHAIVMLSAGAVIPIASMLAWVFLLLAYINGKAPVRDDVTHFLDACPEGFSPLLVSAAAAAIIGIGIAFMVKKEIVKTAIQIVKENRS